MLISLVIWGPSDANFSRDMGTDANFSSDMGTQWQVQAMVNTTLAYDCSASVHMWDNCTKTCNYFRC
jgi:hypothetical protein